jgi:hypothetical protein
MVDLVGGNLARHYCFARRSREVFSRLWLKLNVVYTKISS